MSTSESVLVPLDGSPEAEAALAYALELPNVDITLLAVIDPFDTDSEKIGYQSPIGRAGMPGYSREWYEPTRELIGQRFVQAQAAVGAQGVSFSTHIEFGKPARSIIRYADKHEIDHIVMGTHGRTGLARLMHRSVSEKVVRCSTVPVTTIHDC
jgi:nucleotide-binding universal stress UspA family protein